MNLQYDTLDDIQPKMFYKIDRKYELVSTASD